jgi:hypothetical protein
VHLKSGLIRGMAFGGSGLIRVDYCTTYCCCIPCLYYRFNHIKVFLLFFQKKDANIKIIPPFKPIPADNATPDSTPEKNFPSNFAKMKVCIKIFIEI